jgi:hypothetical protein
MRLFLVCLETIFLAVFWLVSMAALVINAGLYGIAIGAASTALGWWMAQRS